MTGAVPEWAVLDRKDIEQSEGGSDAVSACWTAIPAMALRGSAHTNFSSRSMSIPIGDDARSRAVRGHELLHARLSPYQLSAEVLAVWGVSERSIMAAEELRINTVLKSSDLFDYKQLKDGSEVNHARSIAGGSEVFLYEAVCHLVTTMNTGAEAGVIKELRTRYPLIVDVRKRLRTWIKGSEARGQLRSTHPMTVTIAEDQISYLPTGFVRFTVPVAMFLDSLRSNEGEPTEDYEQRVGTTVKGKHLESGKSAPLIIANPELTENGRNFLSRSRRSSSSGRMPKRLHRMLTDPERRVFDRVNRHAGGIVVIDCSGSMDLSPDQVREIVRQAAGCTVIAYSLRSMGAPNAWILAKDGNYVSDDNFPTMNHANGVDQTVLEWAIRNRKKPSDPIVWVCDGQVTDCNDDPTQSIQEACARLAVSAQIRQVPNVEQAVDLLREWGRGRKAPPSLFGQVARWADHHGLISITSGDSRQSIVYYE